MQTGEGATISFGDYAEKKLLDHIYGATSYAPLATLYFALWTDSNSAAQRDAGTVTEVPTATWTNYQRAAVTNNTTNFPNASGTLGTKNNATAIGPTAFLSSGTSVAASASVTVTAVGIYDAATSGNLIAWFPLTQSKTVSNGDTFTLPINSVTLTLD